MHQGLHPHQAIMSGHGYYNRHSVLQAAAVELGLDTLREAAADVPIPVPPQPLIVADYGCAHGQNSLAPMGVAITALRTRTDLPVTVIHTDLPGNDFSAVFESIATDPRSYTKVDGNAYGLAAGHSFYDTVLPPASAVLGWSSTTTHWLSRVPGPVPGHLTAQSTHDDHVRALFAEQAAADWHGFLAARATEIAPGGRLVMVEPCAHPDGHLGSEPMMELMNEVMHELVAEGLATPEGAAEATLPMWMRSPDEYEQPIAAHPDLELVSGQVVEGLKSPLWDAFEHDGDAPRYAEQSVATMRAWSESMLAAGLDDPAVLDEFYRRCQERGTADPERLHVQIFHVVLDIARR